MTKRFTRHLSQPGAADLLPLWHRNAIEQFLLTVRDEDDGLYDFGITWIRQDSTVVMRLQMFEDAWGAFVVIPELFEALADAEGYTPERMAALLREQGFEES